MKRQVILLFTVLIFVCTIPLVSNTVKATSYSYTFNGPFNENYGIIYPSSTLGITITAYFSDTTAPTIVTVLAGTGTHTDTYTPASQPLYFKYSVSDYTGTQLLYDRLYYLSPNENSGTYNIFGSNITGFGVVATPYLINFLDYMGVLKSNPYIEAQIFINGSYMPVERRIIDITNSVTMYLQQGNTYRILYGDGINWTTYGNLVPASSSGIQLVLRGLAFSSQVLQLYQYVHAYSIRDFLNPTGDITVSYEDTLSKTTSVTVTITDAVTGVVAVSQIFTSQTFSYTWTGVDNATNYEVTTYIDHQSLGLFNYKQYLPGEYTKASAPFDLAFLGTSTGISTAVLIPALLIIFVAACFSELTAETAAILTCIVAILLTALGFIQIGQAAIISALSLSVLAAVVTARKRMQYS